MTDDELKILIETKLANGTKAFVQSPDNVHFEAIVISELFSSMPNKVKQQRMVYEALGNKIESGEVHALSLKTYTPAMWEKVSHK